MLTNFKEVYKQALTKLGTFTDEQLLEFIGGKENKESSEDSEKLIGTLKKTPYGIVGHHVPMPGHLVYESKYLYVIIYSL